MTLRSAPFLSLVRRTQSIFLRLRSSFASPLSVPIQTMFCRSRKSVRSELLGSDVGSDSEL